MDLRDLTFSYYVRRLSRKTLPDSILSGNVVELGAGIDNYSTLFEANRYTAVDVWRPAQRVEYSFVQADICLLPFGTNAFDYFIASNVLEHIKSPGDVLERLYSICSGGGYIVVPVNGKFPFIYDPINWIRKRLGLPICNFGIGGFGHVSLLSEAEWENLFSKNNFTIVSKSYMHMDAWSCIEFFVFSIFFSRKEYVTLCNSNAKVGNFNFLARLLYFIQKVQAPIFRFLKATSWSPSGYICVSYTLNKRI
ncbi:MAG: class I SAM-dependent methyltransferase [Proteobacteria bacterium]|nr:class I SAM-dependent methyltransferase [Pseudomonadota bacterium]